MTHSTAGDTALAPTPHGMPARAAHWDAVIIGSGAGGATAAWQLARHGLKILIVERGGRLLPATGGSTGIGRFLYHEVKDQSAPLSYVGGQTKFYGAALYRFRESDFKSVAHESGESPAWPISYEDLAPYYDQGEILYRVHGTSLGDPTEPARTVPYPYPPLPQDPLLRHFDARLRAAGAQTAPIPRALDYGAGGNCVMCPTCDAHYCQRDAKMDAETAPLAQALATGNVFLQSGTECITVMTDPAGRRATGVRLRDASGDFEVHCGIILVGAGLPGSAALLRRSRTARHPNGLGNHSFALGRYLAGHAVGMAFPLLGLRALPSAHTKDFAINSFYHGAPGWPHPLGVVQTGGQTPFWETAPRWQRPLAKWIGQRSLICFYMSEALPTAQSGFGFDGDSPAARTEPLYNTRSFARLRELTVDLFRRAGYRTIARRRAPYLWHETGTARMGDDPGNSVVDRNCQVHGIEGLYVVDASVLPSAGAVNTGLTIIALALRAGDHIAGKMAHADTPAQRTAA